MTDHAQLIGRLEAASEGSRELDRDMMLLVGDAREVDHCTFYGPDERVWYFGEYEHETDLPPLPYLTSSLDAIVALIERKLPGWMIERVGEHVFADHRAKGPFLATLRTSPNLPGLTFAQCHYARSRPLALCIAFLRALQAQQETSEDE